MNVAPQTVMYVITVFLHFVAMLIYLHVGYRAWRRPDIEAGLKITMIGGCSFAILLSGIFSALQIDWLVTNKHELIGNDLSYAWLIFDYLLVIYLIIMGQLLNVITQWSRSSGRRRHFLYPPEDFKDDGRNAV